THTLGKATAGSCTASDALSGVNASGGSVTLAGGLANGVGTFSYTGSTTDKAGNPASVSGTYRVIYRFDGFLQPINDTAHQVGLNTSIFKAGSTMPVKLQLKRAGGAALQANTIPTLD